MDAKTIAKNVTKAANETATKDKAKTRKYVQPGTLLPVEMRAAVSKYCYDHDHVFSYFTIGMWEELLKKEGYLPQDLKIERSSRRGGGVKALKASYEQKMQELEKQAQARILELEKKIAQLKQKG